MGSYCIQVPWFAKARSKWRGHVAFITACWGRRETGLGMESHEASEQALLCSALRVNPCLPRLWPSEMEEAPATALLQDENAGGDLHSDFTSVMWASVMYKEKPAWWLSKLLLELSFPNTLHLVEAWLKHKGGRQAFRKTSWALKQDHNEERESVHSISGSTYLEVKMLHTLPIPHPQDPLKTKKSPVFACSSWYLEQSWQLKAL